MGQGRKKCAKYDGVRISVTCLDGKTQHKLCMEIAITLCAVPTEILNIYEMLLRQYVKNYLNAQNVWDKRRYICYIDHTDTTTRYWANKYSHLRMELHLLGPQTMVWDEARNMGAKMMEEFHMEICRIAELTDSKFGVITNRGKKPRSLASPVSTQPETCASGAVQT